jgi:hypothetical protein
VLLKHRQTITDLAKGKPQLEHDTAEWAAGFNEVVDERAFADAVKHMAMQRKEILLSGSGRDVVVAATRFAEIPAETPAWRRLDARLTCWAVRGLPPAVFDRDEIAQVVENMILQAVA